MNSTQRSYQPLRWCTKCRIPLIGNHCENCGSQGQEVCSDLKPMWKEEVELIEKRIGKRFPGRDWQDGLWMRYRTIWFQGKRLLRLHCSSDLKIVEKNPVSMETGIQAAPITKNILYKGNRSFLEKLEKEAISFIRQTVKKFPKKKPVVSISGGKDSAVVSFLVAKALRPKRISYMFADTTMEYSDTYKYIKRFLKRNQRSTFHKASNPKTFFEMCKIIGPPSRLNAWCCSVFKSSPIAQLVQQINGDQGIISFEGIRRKESIRRRNRERLYESKKVSHQLSAYPILDWREAEVWIYILTKEIDFNDAYRKGFSRVGCMFCPNNVPYNEYLMRVYYPKSERKWKRFLFNYARKIGKKDISDYVNSGAWKMRIGRREGENVAYVKKVPCLKRTTAMHFILDKKIRREFAERFKPFGHLTEFADVSGKGFIVKDLTTNESLFMIKRVSDISILKQESKIDPSWKLGEEFLCVDILTSKSSYRLSQRIEKQIRKYQACVLCGACAGICPRNAISVDSGYHINEERCDNCGRCLTTKYLRDSCVSLHANLQTKRYRNGNRI